MRVEPGATIAGEALIRNIGHAEAFKNEWSVTLRPWSKRTRGGRKMEINAQLSCPTQDIG